MDADSGLELMRRYEALRATRDEAVRSPIKHRIRAIVDAAHDLFERQRAGGTDGSDRRLDGK